VRVRSLDAIDRPTCPRLTYPRCSLVCVEVSERTEGEADALEQQALGLLDKARELLVESDALCDESAYAFEVAEAKGHLRPWGTRSTRAGAGAVAVDEARRRVESDVRELPAPPQREPEVVGQG
jgi:hypothetical protein